MNLKTCSKCKQAKPHDQFHSNIACPDGRDYYCKACKNEASKAGRDARIAKRKAARAVAAPPPAPHSAPLDPLPEPEIDITVVEPEPDPLAEAYRYTEEAKSRRDLKREHRALLDENERLKAEKNEILSALRPCEIIVYKQPEWERMDAVACAIASDWHVEEEVVGESVHGLNEYNLDIAKSRAEHFFKNWLRLTDIMAKETKVTTMFLAGLGDFFSGWIHEELMANTLLAPGDAARFCKGLFISGLDYLLRESSYIIEGVLIPGNHGRMTDKVHLGDPTGTSLESVMYDAICDRYHNDPRVRLEVSDHAMRYRKFFERFNMRLIHGYEVKYGGGVGGITIPINKALAQWDCGVRANLTVLGHFHQRFDGGNFLVNGSLIGFNSFAQAIKAKYEEAVQSFFMIHARGGGEKSVTSPIWLDSRHNQRTSPETSIITPT